MRGLVLKVVVSLKNKSLYALLIILIAFASPNVNSIWAELSAPNAGTYLTFATVTSPSAPYADFTVSATPTSRAIPAGDSTTYIVTVTPRYGYSSPVTLTVSNLPQGATGLFASSVVTPAVGGVSTTLRVKTERSTKPGTYPLIITGRAVQSHTTTIELIIRGPATKWTFMIYMDGDNNLEYAWGQDLNLMEKVGSTADVSVVVLFDRYSTNEAILYCVTKESPPTNNIVSRQIANWGHVNMGNPETLRRFIAWTAQNYGASHYALVLQNHGGGFMGVCWDDHAGGDCLTMEELRKALGDAGVYFDVIVFYACLMQMVEVAYQIRSFGHYMVASEAVAYCGDINYDLLLSDIVNNPDISGREFAKNVVRRWNRHPSGTISAIDLWLMDDVAISLNNFSQALTSALPNYRKQIQNKRNGTDCYWISFSVDIYRFAQLVQQDETLSRTTLGTASKSLMASIERAVIFNWRGETYHHSHGVSIYFPEWGYIKYYDDLIISRLIQWDEFIKSYELS